MNINNGLFKKSLEPEIDVLQMNEFYFQFAYQSVSQLNFACFVMRYVYLFIFYKNLQK